jgi:hypothetical protein
VTVRIDSTVTEKKTQINLLTDKLPNNVGKVADGVLIGVAEIQGQ